MPAPPQVLRPPAEEALGRDARGLVGIHPEDRPRNVAVLGVPGMGKSALLCRGIAADARDPNTCVIVLDPKGDLHDAALSAIPEGRATSVVAFDRPEQAAVIYTSAVWGPPLGPEFGRDFQSTYFDDWLRWTGITDITDIRYHPTLTGDADTARRSAHAAAREAAQGF